MVMSWIVEFDLVEPSMGGAKQLLVVGQLRRVAEIYAFHDLRNVATDRPKLLRDGAQRLRIIGGKSRPDVQRRANKPANEVGFADAEHRAGRLDPREIVRTEIGLNAPLGAGGGACLRQVRVLRLKRAKGDRCGACGNASASCKGILNKPVSCQTPNYLHCAFAIFAHLLGFPLGFSLGMLLGFSQAVMRILLGFPSSSRMRALRQPLWEGERSSLCHILHHSLFSV